MSQLTARMILTGEIPMPEALTVESVFGYAGILNQTQER
jgi:hypothetical protein